LNIIDLNYSGGSGGFLALWVILIGTNYRCIFNSNSQDLDTIQKTHWNINAVENWKSTEIWPNNDATTTSLLEKKIRFYCNPTKNELNNQSGYKFLIYTDFNTQYKLAKLKNANFFYENSKFEQNNIDSHITNCYNDIKDAQWPNINSFEDFEKLPSTIINEVRQIIGFNNKEDILNQFLEFLQITYQEEKIHNSLENIIITVNSAIKLQDIIKTNGNALLNPLGFTSNHRVRDFVRFWMDLHPPEIQKLLT